MKSSRATEEDAAAEQFLSRHLARAFPEDGFQGEEAELRAAAPCAESPIRSATFRTRWPQVLHFARCLEDGTPLIGVIAAPALGEIFIAMRGW